MSSGNRAAQRRAERQAREARRREEQARRDAENRAREQAQRYEADMRPRENANQARLSQIQAQNEAQASAMEQTMQANLATMAKDPTTIKSRKKKKRGSGQRGMDRLRIAMSQQGSSTNLG